MWFIEVISVGAFTVEYLIRLLRFLRLLKLARYSVAMQRFHRAFLIAREELAGRPHMNFCKNKAIRDTHGFQPREI
ncbi:MAG: hypothetical protein V2J55_08850, partial [Candidatus Competibacteraceae bacterium]|jgi:hypothetical protein|nr:hypothetical protein [Candidatus Competibacteraceae bacterium]